MDAFCQLTRGERAAIEALDWARVETPFVWQQAVKGPAPFGGCDCKMLAAGVARECGFPEAGSVYATVADYSDQRRVPSAYLREGLDRLFDRIEFDRAAARRGEVPSEIEHGDLLLLVMALDPNHLAIAAKLPGARIDELRTNGQPTAVHAKLGSSSKVTETAIPVLLRKYRLAGVYRWKALNDVG